MNPQSYAKFEKREVLEAARRMVRHIDATRSEHKRRMRDREIARRLRWNACWWWPFTFSLHAEDVEASLKKDFAWQANVLDLHEHQRRRCCELIAFCNAPGGEPFIWLSNEHVLDIYGPKI